MAFSLLADAESRSTYFTHLSWLLGQPAVAEVHAADSTYFDSRLIQLGPREFFVDGGAFNGDTLNTFLDLTQQKFDRIVAFEPDLQNYRAMAAAIGQLQDEVRSRIELRNSALGRQRGRTRFAAGCGELSRCSDAGGTEVEIEAMDDSLAGSIPTYIKLDIEGAEPDAIRGAETLIRRHSPKLAVCVYHEPEHLWSLPLLIRSINDSYRLYLRYYRDTADLVCHAKPANAA